MPEKIWAVVATIAILATAIASSYGCQLAYQLQTQCIAAHGIWVSVNSQCIVTGEVK